MTDPNFSERPVEARRLWRQNSIYLLPNSFTIAALFSAF